MKPRILVAREVFPEVLERLRRHFEVEDNQADVVLGVEGLKARLADKVGALTAATDPVTAEVIAAAPQLKAICNFAVGYNNIDLAACTRAGIAATNTPGVLDDTTADLAWALLMATARHIQTADQHMGVVGAVHTQSSFSQNCFRPTVQIRHQLDAIEPDLVDIAALPQQDVVTRRRCGAGQAVPDCHDRTLMAGRPEAAVCVPGCSGGVTGCPASAAGQPRNIIGPETDQQREQRPGMRQAEAVQRRGARCHCAR